MEKDPSKGLDAEKQYWMDLLNAIDDADTLPHDERFVEAVYDNTVSTVYELSWDGEDTPVTLLNDELCRESTLTDSLITPFIDVKRIQLKLIERGGFSDIAGEIKLNDITYLISGSDKWHALQTGTEDLMSPLSIAPRDINTLLTIAAGTFLSEHPSKVASIVDLHLRQNDKSEISGLGATISSMGNLIGQSSRTTLAYFDIAENNGMYVELIDAESPHESGTQNGVHAFLGDNAVDLSTHTIATQQLTTLNARDSTHDMRVGVHYMDDADKNALQLMEQGVFNYPDAAKTVAFENGFSSPQELQIYGALCQQILETYRKWLVKDGFNSPDTSR